MSDRKVLNKYYPPDYDVSKIPRLRLPSNRQVQSRIMLPMSLQCARCGEFIYKGKKFNARKEHCQGEDYLGIKRWRFYFRCPSCLNEITFKTDPQRSGYEVELGATRNYEPWKARADEEAQQRREVEEADADVMRKLERKSHTGRLEQDMAEVIEELRERNSRGDQLTLEDLIQRRSDAQKQREEEEDQRMAREAFNRRPVVGRLAEQQTRHEMKGPMTLDVLDFEVGEEGKEVEKGRDEGKLAGERVEEEVEAEGEGEEDEFVRERKALSVSGLSFAAQAKGVEAEERKEAAVGGPLLPGLNLLVRKRKAAGNEAEADKRRKPGVASVATVPGGPPRAQVALSSLLGGYEESDSD